MLIISGILGHALAPKVQIFI